MCIWKCASKYSLTQYVASLFLEYRVKISVSFIRLKLHNCFAGTSTMKCFADLDVNVSNNIECIDFWHLIQVMSVGEFSVIGSSYPPFVSVSFKKSEYIFLIDFLQYDYRTMSKSMK